MKKENDRLDDEMCFALHDAAIRKARSAETAEDIAALAAITRACERCLCSTETLHSAVCMAVMNFAKKAETVADMKALEDITLRYPSW